MRKVFGIMKKKELNDFVVKMNDLQKDIFKKYEKEIEKAIKIDKKESYKV